MAEENTKLTGTLLISAITPYNSTDSYPTHYAKYGHGGYRTVETETEMNSIPEARRENGMLVYVTEEDKIYKYDGTDFSELALGFGKEYTGGTNIDITDTVISAKGYIFNETLNSIAEGSNTTASGDYSHAEGYNTTASGDYAHAEGVNGEALGHNSHAEGNGCKSIGQNSHAEGTRTTAKDNQAHSEGYETQAIAKGSHAEGDTTKAYGCYSHTEGANSVAGYEGDKPTSNGLTEPSNPGDGAGGYAHAEGAATLAIGKAAHSEGSKTFAYGDFSHAEGVNSISMGYNSHAEGNGSKSIGQNSHAEGTRTIANSNQSHSEGFETKAMANGAHSEGDTTTAYGCYSHVEGANSVTGYEGDKPTSNDIDAPSNTNDSKGGYAHAEGEATLAVGKAAHSEGSKTFASGNYSHAEGSGTIGMGIASHAEGNDTNAGGDFSHAEGLDAEATGEVSHAEGHGTTASGNYSHAEGSQTTASGLQAHSEGYYTTASGDCSHSEGLDSKAEGAYSHAEGEGSTAIGKQSHAEGAFTTASGDYSHAEGNCTQTGASAAHAEGNYTVANGDSSHTEGVSTITNNTGEHAEGKYNISNSKTISSIGIGDSSARCNALEVLSNGDIYIKDIGDYKGGTNGDPYTMENVLSVQAVISNLQEGIEDAIENQTTYTAGNNISISGEGVISAKGYSYVNSEVQFYSEVQMNNGHTFSFEPASNLTSSYSNFNIVDTPIKITNTSSTSTINLDGVKVTSDSEITTSGSISAAQGFFETSDIRKKNVIDELPLDKAYELINNCQSIIYTLKDNTDKQQIGLIAQEVQQYFPEVVSENEDGYLSLDYAKLTSVIFRVLKDVIDRLSKLENK